MILNYPTGTYRTVLPKNAGDSTSVVFTMSNMDPPRSELLFVKVPTGILSEPRPARIYASDVRRRAVGPIIFSSNQQRSQAVVSSGKLYHPGQLIGFEQSTESTVAADPREIADTVTTRHDTNHVDAEATGLNDSELVLLEQQADQAQDVLLGQITQLQTAKKLLEADIMGVNRSINESKRVLTGLNAILAVGFDHDVSNIKQKVDDRLAELQVELDEKINQYNEIPDQIQAIRDKLVALTGLVK